MGVRLFKRALECAGLYHQFRYSRLYAPLLRMRNPSYFRHLETELSFYRQVLGSQCQLVFDIGANCGDKVSVFSQIAKVVVAVEPDLYCQKALRARFRRNESVRLESVAVGACVGQADLYIEESGSVYNTLSMKQRASRKKRASRQRSRTVQVTLTTLDELINKYGVPDYIKVDVEGYETAVFQGLSRKVKIISFECNLPEFLRETLEVLDRLNTPSTSFNLREGDAARFVFSTQQNIVSIADTIMNAATTFDIFVFNNAVI